MICEPLLCPPHGIDKRGFSLIPEPRDKVVRAVPLPNLAEPVGHV